ncbi:hypothetical protein BN961_00829 [Afipia felis]|uniref:Uncharacterized protein n=1 Tax=Afipia felis TaxID=1035 RepID=A0A090MP73_AFIFE|nr:hypothetical protein BN961_00829 [Afipia felis]
MARQPDHAHVVAEILAAELRADAHRLRHLPDFLLHLEIAEGVRVLAALGRQRIEIAGGSELHRLHRQLCGGAADDDGEVIGRTRRGAERENLFFQERQQAVARQKRRRALKQEALVGRAAALGHEHEFVGVVTFGINLALRGHVVARVLFLEHRNRRELRVAQVALEIRIARAFRERGLIVALGEDAVALLAHDDRGAGVLAHRQHAAGRDVSVLQKVEGHEPVVVARLGVSENFPQLREVAGTQIMVDIDEGSFRQRLERLARDHQHLPAQHRFDPHAIGGNLPVGRLVLAERKQRGVLVRRHGGSSERCVHRSLSGRQDNFEAF